MEHTIRGMLQSMFENNKFEGNDEIVEFHLRNGSVEMGSVWSLEVSCDCVIIQRANDPEKKWAVIRINCIDMIVH